MRTLPLRVQPVEGEALDSWLEALCVRMHTTWGDLLGSIGLPAIATRRWRSGILTGLTPREAALAEIATGVSVSVLQAMTLDPVERIVMARATLPRSSISSVLWLHGRRSRFCPECLRESGGRWYLWWRLRWAFACLRHACLLVDTCPDCGRPQRTEPVPAGLVPIPTGCTRKAPDAQGRNVRRCSGHLADAEFTVLLPDHPTLQVQEKILGSMSSGWMADGMYAQSPVAVSAFIADLAALGRRILAYSEPAELAQRLPDNLAALDAEDSATVRRLGVTADASAASVAVAVTAAWLILAASSPGHAGDRMRWLVETSRRKGLSVRATSIGWGRGVSGALVTAQLSALGPFLSPSDHLRFRLHTTSPRPAERGVAERRAASVPTLLWPEWASRLRCRGIGYSQTRSASSVAVLLVGSSITLAGASALMGSQADAHTVSRLLQRWRESRNGPQLFRVITGLSMALDDVPAPIDYDRRRVMDCADLLPEQLWRKLCLEGGMGPGRGLRRQLIQCWLYERLTGLPAYRSLWHEDSPRFRTNLVNLSSWLTVEFVSAIDGYAANYLDDHGIFDEPVTWCPDIRLADRHRPELLELGCDAGEPQRTGGVGHIPESARCHNVGSTTRRHLEAHAPPGLAAVPRISEASRILPQERLAEMYLSRVLSLQRIAHSVGLSRQMVTRLAVAYGIHLRPPGRRRASNISQ